MAAGARLRAWNNHAVLFLISLPALPCCPRATCCAHARHTHPRMSSRTGCCRIADRKLMNANYTAATRYVVVSSSYNQPRFTLSEFEVIADVGEPPIHPSIHPSTMSCPLAAAGVLHAQLPARTNIHHPRWCMHTGLTRHSLLICKPAACMSVCLHSGGAIKQHHMVGTVLYCKHEPRQMCLPGFLGDGASPITYDHTNKSKNKQSHVLPTPLSGSAVHFAHTWKPAIVCSKAGLDPTL